MTGAQFFRRVLKQGALQEFLGRGEVLDSRRAALILGYSKWGIHRLCRRRQIKHFRVMINGRTRYYFLPSDLEKLFARP
jgi:hypothetical protein